MQNATRPRRAVHAALQILEGGEEVGANAPLANAHQRPRAIMAAVTPASVAQLPPLRPWQRLSVRVARLFVAVTLLAVGLVGEVLYERQKRETEATLGALLLNIARTGAYLIDPDLHMVVQRTLTQETSAYLRVYGRGGLRHDRRHQPGRHDRAHGRAERKKGAGHLPPSVRP